MHVTMAAPDQEPTPKKLRQPARLAKAAPAHVVPTPDDPAVSEPAHAGVLASFSPSSNIFVMTSEVGNLYAAEGKPKPVQEVTGFWILLPIVGYFVWFFKVQGHLNKFWTSHGAVAG
jgi:hypothetical protein